MLVLQKKNFKQMKTALLFTLLLLFLVTKSYGQEFYSVVAKSGLIIRQRPDVKAQRIGKFSCGEDLELVRKTSKHFKIKDQNHSISGYWYLVKSKTSFKGYVFGGYLLKKHDDWKIGNTCENETVTCSTKFSTEEHNFEIYNFQIEGNEHRKDTLLLHEATFNEIGDKLLKIEPKKGVKQPEVYYTRLETLNDWGTTKNAKDIIPKWKGQHPFIKLNVVNGNFYRVPKTNYDDTRELTAKKLNLKRSSDWDEVGEGWWIPRYNYKGLIVPYQIKSIILKIVSTDLNGKKKVNYIEINLSYGC